MYGVLKRSVEGRRGSREAGRARRQPPEKSMVFTTAENPANRKPTTPSRPRGIPAGRRHRAEDGSWWETTGDVRIIEAGEHALTHLGVSRALRRSRRAYPVLRPISVPRRLVA